MIFFYELEKQVGSLAGWQFGRFGFCVIYTCFMISVKFQSVADKSSESVSVSLSLSDCGLNE